MKKRFKAQNVRWNLWACVLGLLLAASPGSGATFTVMNLNDSGAGSLRQAVSDTNSNPGTDTIVFSGGGASGVITLATGQLTLTDSTGATTIAGPGANLLTVSGDNASRVFEINTGVTAAVTGLTIANGTRDGGAGILNNGALTLTACTLRNNSSAIGGGGIESEPGSSLTVIDSLFTNNQALFGAAIEHLSRRHQAVLTNVTVSGNTCTSSETGPVEAAFGANIRLESCTVTDNTSGTGNSGGVNAYLAGSVVEYRSTIVAGNTVQQFANNGGTLTSLGHNISSDATGNLVAAGDQPSTFPLLSPLADNGGPTQTHACLAGSPAMDAGDPVTFPKTDQRGAPRPGEIACAGMPAPDIGAFESQASDDTDGDSVSDACDTCPNTIPGVTVDASGCPPVFLGDFDRDGDVDAADLDQFEACSTSPGVPQVDEGCVEARLDGDDDVDQTDFGLLQRCVSGENVPADAGCAG